METIKCSGIIEGKGLVKIRGILKVKKLSADAILPKRGNSRAAGFDLYAPHDHIIPPRGHSLVTTDIAIQLPESDDTGGYYVRIKPRSSYGIKGTDVGAGVVDNDYRGNIGVVFFNHTDQDFIIKKGEKFAQMIIEKSYVFPVEEVEELGKTERGDQGYGSTGK